MVVAASFSNQKEFSIIQNQRRLNISPYADRPWVVGTLKWMDWHSHNRAWDQLRRSLYFVIFSLLFNLLFIFSWRFIFTCFQQTVITHIALAQLRFPWARDLMTDSGTSAQNKTKIKSKIFRYRPRFLKYRSLKFSNWSIAKTCISSRFR